MWHPQPVQPSGLVSRAQTAQPGSERRHSASRGNERGARENSPHIREQSGQRAARCYWAASDLAAHTMMLAAVSTSHLPVLITRWYRLVSAQSTSWKRFR